ncbi:MAG: DUF1648 domain-containing protein [Ferruginibacter sp.]
MLIIMWGFTIVNYLKSPEIVPIHYDSSGNINGYGSKLTILFLPLIPTIIFWGLTQLNKYPHVFNYMTEITADNAERQYTGATRMIRILKVSCVLMFTIDTLSAFLTTIGIIKGLGVWFLPLSIILLVLPIILAIIQPFKKK